MRGVVGAIFLLGVAAEGRKHCLAGDLNGDKCHILSDIPMSWNAARLFCKYQYNGTLFSNIRAPENVRSFAHECNLKATEMFRADSCWTGLNDRDEIGVWKDAEGQPASFFNWEADPNKTALCRGEGRDHRDECEPDCVIVDGGDFFFKAVDCENRFPFLCETDAKEEDFLISEFSIVAKDVSTNDFTAPTAEDLHLFDTASCVADTELAPDEERFSDNPPGVFAFFQPNPVDLLCFNFSAPEGVTHALATWTFGDTEWNVPYPILGPEASRVQIPRLASFQQTKTKRGQKLQVAVGIDNMDPPMARPGVRIKIVDGRKERLDENGKEVPSCMDSEKKDVARVIDRTGDHPMTGEARDLIGAEFEFGGGGHRELELQTLVWRDVQIDIPGDYDICVCLWGNECADETLTEVKWLQAGTVLVEGASGDPTAERTLVVDDRVSEWLRTFLVNGYGVSDWIYHPEQSRLEFVEPERGCRAAVNVKCDGDQTGPEGECDTGPDFEIGGVQAWVNLTFRDSLHGGEAAEPARVLACHCYDNCGEEENWQQVGIVNLAVPLPEDQQGRVPCGLSGGPCENRGVCVAMPSGLPNECVCPLEWMGDLCGDPSPMAELRDVPDPFSANSKRRVAEMLRDYWGSTMGSELQRQVQNFAGDLGEDGISAFPSEQQEEEGEVVGEGPSEGPRFPVTPGPSAPQFNNPRDPRASRPRLPRTRRPRQYPSRAYEAELDQKRRQVRGLVWGLVIVSAIAFFSTVTAAVLIWMGRRGKLFSSSSAGGGGRENGSGGRALAPVSELDLEGHGVNSNSTDMFFLSPVGDGLKMKAASFASASKASAAYKCTEGGERAEGGTDGWAGKSKSTSSSPETVRDEVRRAKSSAGFSLPPPTVIGGAHSTSSSREEEEESDDFDCGEEEENQRLEVQQNGGSRSRGESGEKDKEKERQMGLEGDQCHRDETVDRLQSRAPSPDFGRSQNISAGGGAAASPGQRDM
uniref:C-type lectin domain-containing protein n=1 Tax=Chromera velia CCMP2878 TaxID=1169474 RepID=A0A0G4FA98_9ALVE|mmetsp:Transcript_13856/g.27618  ORF Transcript_13856/g.27618 Transcript_13856/m.27618 type:complete len:982 (-) Transcript_13856:1914-4859(-)|eukprot:Cvel_15848.t1-p1 / transcript=Cvel_15848.t1 / gene=Cvel_15848 / organism=Chromera_velia_CCMP2878 / gene_product=hypothetical protein / transcript_product=hypothetical protein / location=Cvel_scaffold1193:26515-32212(-) / protein_length=981 / sequence_SO=supercontig / SO=protein_coding / is_pseudo=false